MSQRTAGAAFTAASVLFNLPEYEVLEVTRDQHDGGRRVVISTPVVEAACPDCCVLTSRVHQRTHQRLADSLTGGKWFSYYDRVYTTDPSTFGIDHIALAEAWDSGARTWDSDTRKRFANDLGDRRSLVAVTASSNRSKGDRDPVDWMPTYDRCAYVKQWIAVKIRWSLTVNRAEKDRLSALAADCPATTLTVSKAVVRRA